MIYGLGSNKSYQLDSSKKLLKPLKKDRIMEPKISVVDNVSEKPAATHQQTVREEIQIKNNSTILTPLTKDKKKGVSKFWNKVSEWF